MFPVLALPLLAPTLYHPRCDQVQSIGYLLFLEYLLQHVSPFEATDTLTIVVPDAVQLVLPFTNLLLELLQRIHGPAESRYLGDEGFVPDALKGVINFMTSRVVTE